MRNFMLIIVSLVCSNSAFGNNNSKKKILMMAPNFLTNHFNFSAHLADLLVQDGHQVHFLIVNTADKQMPVPKGVSRRQFVNLNSNQSLEIPHDSSSYEVVTFDDGNFYKEFDDLGDEKLGNKWQHRGYSQHKKILQNEAFFVCKELAKKSELIRRLHRAKFDLAIFDTWDLGALYIFFLAGIPHTIGFNKIQLLSYQLKYAGTLGKLAPNVPEVYATRIGDANADEMRRSEFPGEHEANSKLFEAVHRQMDEWFHGEEMAQLARKHFHWLPGKEEWFRVEQLYGKMAKLFANQNPLLDFPLGEAKPANMAYFGGIHLVPSLRNLKVDRSAAKVVLFSLKNCKRMLEPTNRNALDAFLEAFEQFPHFRFIVDWPDFVDKVVVRKNVEFIKVQNFQQRLAEGDIRLLIANCGTGGSIEAVAAGIPLLCVPFSVDQFYIGEALASVGREHGQAVAKSVDINAITLHKDSKQIVAALEEMLDGQVYLDNAARLRDALHKQWSEGKTPERVFLDAVKEV